MTNPQLIIRGTVARPGNWTWEELAQWPAAAQIDDVSQIDARRAGRAIRLMAILEQVGVHPTAEYVTLHATQDNFHASIPLAAVRERAVLIYALNDGPLPQKSGGPFRFLIPDHAACHTAEIDECANVKFIDCIEFSSTRGHDNRPLEDQAHAELHQRQQQQ